MPSSQEGIALIQCLARLDICELTFGLFLPMCQTQQWIGQLFLPYQWKCSFLLTIDSSFMKFSRFYGILALEKRKNPKQVQSLDTVNDLFHPLFYFGKRWSKVKVSCGVKREVQITFDQMNEKKHFVPVGDTGTYMQSLGSGRSVFPVHLNCSFKLCQNWWKEVHY